MDNARREYVVDLRIDRITTELLNTQSLRCTKGDPRMNCPWARNVRNLRNQKRDGTRPEAEPKAETEEPNQWDNEIIGLQATSHASGMTTLVTANISNEFENMRCTKMGI